jgi:hypothetical protein
MNDRSLLGCNHGIEYLAANPSQFLLRHWNLILESSPIAVLIDYANLLLVNDDFQESDHILVVELREDGHLSFEELLQFLVLEEFVPSDDLNGD